MFTFKRLLSPCLPRRSEIGRLNKFYTTSNVSHLNQIEEHKSHGGHMKRFSHKSEACSCTMTFNVYLPPNPQPKTPVLWYLSGLTCTDLNFSEKAGAQRLASQYGLALIAPDTSPRGLGYPGEADNWDFGVGAGMYVDATESPWKVGYRMYTYISKELPDVIKSNFELDISRQSIFGHSMGGHGALIMALKNPGKYRSVSAFAPLCNPSRASWGVKAFSLYLGPDKESWKAYDATELIKSYNGPKLDILVDQGDKDPYIKTDLVPETLVSSASGNKKVNLNLRMQAGYDHGYYFVSTFMEDHFKHHIQYLK